MTRQVIARVTAGRHDGRMSSTTLRTVLRMNATTSALGGLAAAIAPGQVDRLLETGQTTWVRLVGIGLLGFAAWVWVVSRRDAATIRERAREISIADASWVLGSIVTIVLGWYSAAGNVVIGLVATIVGAFGTAQFALSRPTVDGGRPVTVSR